MSELIQNKIPFEIQAKRVMLWGVIWGIIELIVPPIIKALLPTFSAFLVPFVIFLFVLTLKYFLPTPGTIMLMAIISASIKFLVSEAVLTGSFMAILIEAALVELTFIIFNFRFRTFIISGILVELYVLIHPILSKGVFYESHQFIVFERWIGNLFGYELSANMPDGQVLISLIILHLLFGVLTGWLAWKIVLRLINKQKST
jgi:hypothetical protein